MQVSEYKEEVKGIMNGEVRQISMRTNFDGLIKLLADGLYSTSDIFLRELIQNGHDGIIRRQAEKEKHYQGTIAVTFDKSDNSISIEDNGIGMDEKDIEEFLSVIGSTGTGTKRSELEARFSDELIGQFGIGLLSAFLVANKVQVQTRKLGCDSAFEWVNTGSTECQIRRINRREVGSTVKVFVRSEFTYLLNRSKLEEIIIHYCDFITVPITINGVGPVNAIYAPWDKDFGGNEEQRRDYYSTFVNRRFSDSALDVFPIEIHGEYLGKEYRADGVLYISDRHLAGVNTMGSLDIFVRKMLVKENDSTLLPTWAQFIHGVIDSPDLKPTAGRDNINQDTPAFHYIQEELGRIIVERLAYLAKNRPDKFIYINQWHHETLKGMAMVNDSFFDMVGDLLLFQTNMGDISMAEYLPKNALLDDNRTPVYYFSHYTSAAQYYRMADEKGICVINAGRSYDEQVLEKYGRKHPEIKLEKLDVLDKGIFFEELSLEERRMFQPLEQIFSYRMNNVLMINSIVSTKSFRPEEVPLVIVESESDKDERELTELLNNPVLNMNFKNALQGLKKRMQAKPIQLTLNSNNPLIQKLIQMEDTIAEADYATIITMLYNNALLYSHRLDEKNMNIIHDGIVHLMARLLECNTEVYNTKKQVEDVRRQQQQLAGTIIANEVKRTEHVRLFMMTPFDESYRPVEEAVRIVFEQAPFFFEVRLARDYYSEGTLVKNVRKHLMEAHGFIAEISELNPNVMMEIGGVLLSGDERPMFVLKSKDAIDETPADFGDKLIFHYDNTKQGAKEIAEKIREIIFTDGRVSHGEVEKLMKRSKKHFLSKTLLSSFSSDIILKQDMINSICSRFNTLEELVAASEEELKATGMKPYVCMAIQEEMKNMLDKLTEE